MVQMALWKIHIKHILPTYFPHDSPIVWMKSPVPGLPRLDDDELLEDELLDALSCRWNQI
jgi:hypothetical protein